MNWYVEKNFLEKTLPNSLWSLNGYLSPLIKSSFLFSSFTG